MTPVLFELDGASIDSLPNVAGVPNAPRKGSGIPMGSVTNRPRGPMMPALGMSRVAKEDVPHRAAFEFFRDPPGIIRNLP